MPNKNLKNQGKQHQIAQLIERAINFRKKIIAQRECCRLFDGIGDGLEGLWIDRLGSVILIHVDQELNSNLGLPQEVGQALRKMFVNIDIFYRVHDDDPKRSAKSQAELISRVSSTENSDVRIITEYGLKFEIRPREQVNAGFFLDMAEVRRRLQTESKGKRVLNTFCFTGSLGIAAWAGGATEVVQVDLSQKILKWAKRNFELNQNLLGATGQMRFICEDALKFMQREQRRIQAGKARYDLVILDPPTFGAGTGRRFQIKEDAVKLVSLALSILAPGGQFLFTSNYRGFSAAAIRKLIEQTAKETEVCLTDFEQVNAPSEEFRAPDRLARSMRGVLVSLIKNSS